MGKHHGFCSSYTWNRILTFTLPKTITLMIWQIGLIHKSLQGAVIGYLVYSLYTESSWAYTEVPVESVNAFVEIGADTGWIEESGLYAASVPAWCSDPAYSFKWSPAYDYTNPTCMLMNAHECTAKFPEPARVDFVTVFIETEQIGWDCAGSDNVANTQSCADGGGTMTTQQITQCVCTTRRTVYPMGVDDLLLSFSHSYNTTTAMGSLEGNSAVTGDKGIETILVDSDGNQVGSSFPSGETISMSVKDWLEAANINLDQDNVASNSFDMDEPSKMPKVRTTGVAVYIELDYTNKPRGADKPSFSASMQESVHAKMSVRAEASQWASLGGSTVYPVYPTGPPGRQSYHKVVRYTQIVSFRFRGTGLMYRLNWLYLLNAFLAGIVLLGVAKTITSIIAKYLYYDRTMCRMIRNKAMEKLAIGTRLAELGVKASSYAATFNALDDNGDGKLDVEDLVKTLRETKYPISEANLHAIATLVIKRSSMLSKEDEEPDQMDYAEFMSVMEGGAVIPFEEFSEMVSTFCVKRGYTQKGIAPEPEAYDSSGAKGA